MATKTLIQTTDDIDDSTENVETVEFSIAGITYEIDLSPKNQEKLTKALAPYVSAGRRTGGRQKRSSGRAPSPTKLDLSAVRQWATANGHEVSSRGRVPAAVITAYEAAH